MADSQTHSTLREWRMHIRQPVTLATLAGLGLLLALAGPFGTDDLLALPAAFAYWGFIAASTYSLGFMLADATEHKLRQRWPAPFRVLLCGSLTAVGVMAIVFVLNFLVFGFIPAGERGAAFAATVYAVTLTVTALLHILQNHYVAAASPVAQSAPSDAPPTQPAPPELMARIPLETRGPLIALSVQDHYVEVRTTKGTHLLLMRLSDAMQEARAADGLQIHRSHWVALDQVTAVKRIGDRAMVTLSDGTERPASRRYIPALKEAGLLPR